MRRACERSPARRTHAVVICMHASRPVMTHRLVESCEVVGGRCIRCDEPAGASSASGPLLWRGLGCQVYPPPRVTATGVGHATPPAPPAVGGGLCYIAPWLHCGKGGLAVFLLLCTDQTSGRLAAVRLCYVIAA
jgi:hypothetical protein